MWSVIKFIKYVSIWNKVTIKWKTNFCTKTKLSDFKITPPVVKLDMFSSNLVSNGSIWCVSEKSIGTITKNLWQPSSPVKCILPNEKPYPLSKILCFVLFEVTFILMFFSLLSKSVSFTKSAISTLFTKLVCALLAAKLSTGNVFHF